MNITDGEQLLNEAWYLNILNKKKLTNIAVFIPHMGCPHRCSFCNQHIITGNKSKVLPEDLKNITEEQIPFLKEYGYEAEIAFFGGTFTALNRGYMVSLLKTAKIYKGKYPDIIRGIRCSTRPDAVDKETLDLLREYEITAIELGAQSMDDGVLKANRRGHTARDTENAAALIKEYGFELGLQMMTGLYRDTPELSLYTAEEFIRLKPDTVRIYPTVIMPDTELAELFAQNRYESFDFETTLDLCARFYGMFTANGIRVIRVGLDTEAAVEKNMLGGCYHPAMGELCVSRYFFYKIKEYMLKSGAKSFIIETDKRFVSKIIGHKSLNRKKLNQLGFEFKIIEKSNQPPLIKVMNNI